MAHKLITMWFKILYPNYVCYEGLILGHPEGKIVDVFKCIDKDRLIDTAFKKWVI
jgi:hypothetical protein